MMTFRRASLGLVLAAAAGSVSGCAIVNGEEYSLVVRRKAHRYREFTPQEQRTIARQQAAVRKEAEATTRISDPDPTGLVPLSDRFRELGMPLPWFGSAAPDPAPDAFTPFAYCHLHESRHLYASLTAIVGAPIEYTVYAGTGVAVEGLRFAWNHYVVGFWELMFPSTAPVERPPSEPKPAGR